MIESAYETLKVSRDATPEEVRSAYVRLLRRYPPEHFPERFAAIHAAYRTLHLEDDILMGILDDIQGASSAEFAGFLWGDRRELRMDEPFDLRELLPLLLKKETVRELEDFLNTVNSEGIEWRDVE